MKTFRNYCAVTLLALMPVRTMQAQVGPSGKLPRQPTEFMNAMTLNFPAYAQCSRYPGFSIGAEYSRLLNANGTIGASLSFSRLLWAGTAEAGKYYANGTRANIKANLIGAGFNFYPSGTDESAYFEFGAQVLGGQMRRKDSYQPHNSYILSADSVENSTFVVPQLHAALSFRGHDHFLFTLYGDFGQMLTSGEKTKGNYGVLGIKIGGRF